MAPAAFCMPLDEANMPGLKSGLSVVEVGPSTKDWKACRAKLFPTPDEEPDPDPDDEEDESELAEEPDDELEADANGEAPVACRMLAQGELEPLARAESGDCDDDDVDGSSSSPKKLLIADMAGLRPAMASGVSKSDGRSGAENSRPNLSGFDNRPEASASAPPPAACLSVADFRIKNGA